MPVAFLDRNFVIPARPSPAISSIVSGAISRCLWKDPPQWKDPRCIGDQPVAYRSLVPIVFYFPFSPRPQCLVPITKITIEAIDELWILPLSLSRTPKFPSNFSAIAREHSYRSVIGARRLKAPFWCTLQDRVTALQTLELFLSCTIFSHASRLRYILNFVPSDSTSSATLQDNPRK